jgi:HAE1 family hydrophobic/amphiphilic exporter-1
MKLSKFSIRRPVSISMMILIVVVFGAISFFRIPVDFLPEMEFPVAFVMTTYAGAAPEETENLVTKWIEESVNTVDNIKKVSSFSQEGMSAVVVEFNWGTNMDFATQDMREKIDMASMYLPDDVDKPIVMKFDPSNIPVIWMGVSSNQMSSLELRKYADDVLKDQFERVKGVAAAYLYGGDKREILIDVDMNKLEAYGISLDLIKNNLRMGNKNLPAGKISTLHKRYLVRSVGEFDDIDEIKEMPLINFNGNVVKLKDVADVLDTVKERNDIARLNGKQSVSMAIIKQTGTNTLAVSGRINKVIEEMKKALPMDLALEVSFDQGLYVRRSSEYLSGNLKAGGILAMVIVFLFLKNVRSTLIIGLSIPISVIATFILIYFKGMTLNAMSMGGLALGVGMLVDNSVVVLENIYRHFALGEERHNAADIGATEVGMPIFASTVTTVAVFLPIAFTTGIAGKIFKELAWTVSFSLFMSLFAALTVVPMLCSKILRLKEKEKRTEERLRRTKGVYYHLIGYSLNHRYKIILIAFLIFAGTVFLTTQIGKEFIEQSDANEIVINIEMPKGTSLQETNRVVSIFEKAALEMPETKNVFILMGFEEEEANADAVGEEQGSHTGFMVISLIKESERKKNVNEIIDSLRGKANIPGLKMKFQDTMAAILAMGSPVQIKIFGDDLKTLSELSEKVYGSIKDIHGLVDLNRTTLSGKPELQIKFDRDKLSDFNLNVEGVSESIKTAMQGSVASYFREAGKEYSIRVRLQEKFREDIDSLSTLIISSSDGRQVRLNEIAAISNVLGPSKIDRENQTRYVLISGDTSGRDLGSVTKDINEMIKKVHLPPGYFIDFGGEGQEMKEAFESLFFALILAIVIVYMVMAAEFESLVDPLVIMFTLPLALTGAIIALFITGHALSIISYIGIIMLIGIVVNNAIVLVDYINLLRRKGMEKDEAIKQAGVTRLRPILITALTTMFGLFPIALGIGEGAETRAPMAIAVIGGLLTSTLLTLVVIPVTYSLLESAGASVKKRVKRLVWGEEEA